MELKYLAAIFRFLLKRGVLRCPIEFFKIHFP